MISQPDLNQLFLDVLSGSLTWQRASKRYVVEEYIETFRHTRAIMEKTIADMTDDQVRYVIKGNPTWSISEMITHLIFSQNFYYNNMLDITTAQLPHIMGAAKGFGEGAQAGITADILRSELKQATLQINQAIETTCASQDPQKTTHSSLFGVVDYRTWILLLLAHEADHVRQGIIMRRAARVALANTIPE
jgi:hypothetical protein